jgi:SAM-dependent methyltransferase
LPSFSIRSNVLIGKSAFVPERVQEHMNSIADSDAFFDPERMLAQHQAALTLLQGRLSPPAVTEYRWLDLGCGRGQIIAHLKDNLSSSARAKIHFLGYDVDNAHSRGAERTAESLGLATRTFLIGEISGFHSHPLTDGPWDFITLTNTVHEIAPSSLATILARSLERLSVNGCFFAYDMEQLPSFELGAVLWTRDDFSAILRCLCRCLGATTFEPEVGRWRHKSCFGWNVQLRPSDMALPQDWKTRIGDCLKPTTDVVVNVLRQKLAQVTTALESLTRFGAETEEERIARERYLYSFWSISRALGVKV